MPKTVHNGLSFINFDRRQYVRSMADDKIGAGIDGATCYRFFAEINHVIGKPHLKVAPMEMKADNDDVPFGLQLPHHSNQMTQIVWVQLISGSDFKTPDRGDTRIFDACLIFDVSRDEAGDERNWRTPHFIDSWKKRF